MATKIGGRDLKGPAPKAFLALKDDNHSAPADEKQALANFDSFAESFFDTQRNFIDDTEKRIRD